MAKPKILVSDKLSDAGLALLTAATDVELENRPGLKEAELAELIGGFDALLIRSGSKVTAAVIERANKLKVIGRAGIGVDNVDVPAASKRGIIVMNTPTGNAVTTAEHAISLIMAAARKIPQATASMKGGKWEKAKFEGRELANKTLGVVGLGNIGRIVADRAQGLKMKVIGFDPVLNAEKATSLGVELVTTDDLFRRADVITIHAPLTPETKALLNDDAFAKMKKGVIIVNAARGGIVDEAALERAVRAGKVASAALDVFEKEPIDPAHPLLKLDEVIVTPHLGASTEEAQERVALEVVEQVLAYLRDGVIQNAVNVPAVSKEAAGKLQPYLGVAHKLGVLLGQLEPVQVRELRVTCTGEAGELGVRPVASSAVAGYLARHIDTPVNAISAPFEAKERGIAVVEVCEPSTRGYASTVRVTVTGSAGIHTATGTVNAAGEPRLIGLDGYELDAVMEGLTLVMHNDDQPGVIGRVGTVLGTRQINVSRMQVGLDRASGQALALWSVDSAVSNEVVEELRKLPHVRSVIAVEL